MAAESLLSPLQPASKPAEFEKAPGSALRAQRGVSPADPSLALLPIFCRS